MELNMHDLVVINEIIRRGKCVLIKPLPNGIKILEQNEILKKKKMFTESEHNQKRSLA